jgi:hypothetical protein
MDNQELYAKYEAVMDVVHKGLLAAQLNGKWGLITDNGKELTPFKYTYMSDFFSDGLLVVAIDDKYGAIDINGNEKIPVKYPSLWPFNDGLSQALIDDKLVYIDKDDNEVINARQYDDGGAFYGGVAKVQKNGKWGFIDKTGRNITPLKYDFIGDYIDENLVIVGKLVGKNKKYGLIDKKGHEIIPPQCTYDKLIHPNLDFIFLRDGGEGYVIVADNKIRKYGFIDQEGNIAIPPQYDEVIMLFQGGVAEVKLNGKKLKIDKNGKMIE